MRRRGSRFSMNSAGVISFPTASLTIRRSSPIRESFSINDVSRHQHRDLRDQPPRALGPAPAGGTVAAGNGDRFFCDRPVRVRYGHVRSDRLAQAERLLAEFLA